MISSTTRGRDLKKGPHEIESLLFEKDKGGGAGRGGKRGEHGMQTVLDHISTLISCLSFS